MGRQRVGPFGVRRDPRSRRAFTLIELLVVVGILAVLAAILFPTFAKARASARQTACLSNLKQIGAAFGLYMTDYDDLFPHAIDAADRFRPEIWSDFPEFQRRIPHMPMLHDVLRPYLRSREAFCCPADRGGEVLDTHPWMAFPTSPSTFATHGSSYMFRTEIAFTLMSQSQFATPAGVNVLFDSSGHWHVSGRAIRLGDGELAIERLRDFRYNTLFGDLSARSITYDALQDAWAIDL
jgi:general secretion pathway protein G